MIPQLTPTQHKQNEERKARHQRFNARAQQNIANQLREIERQRWVEQQKAIANAVKLEQARRFFREAWKRIDGAPARISEIQRACAKHYGVTLNDKLSDRRTAKIVRPRQVAMYLSKVITGRSLPEIGRRTGMRDHSTALHAVRKIESLLKIDPQLADDIANIQKLLEPQND